jgi:hypothetical protein
MTSTQRVWISPQAYQRPALVDPGGGIVGDDLSGPPHLTSSMWSYSWFCSSLW